MFKLLQNKIALYALGAFLIIIILMAVTIKVIWEQKETYKYESGKWRDNYASQTLDTWKWKSKAGQLASSAVAEKLTKDQIIKSKDKDIRDLNKYADKLDKKIKDLEWMMKVNIDTIHDTVVRPTIVYIPGTPYYKQYDTVPIGSSFIYREYNSKDSTARYRVDMRGNLYIYYEGDQKQGEWTLKNIIFWRDKLPVITITSDNSSININKIKPVIIDDRKKFRLFNRN